MKNLLFFLSLLQLNFARATDWRPFVNITERDLGIVITIKNIQGKILFASSNAAGLTVLTTYNDFNIQLFEDEIEVTVDHKKAIGARNKEYAEYEKKYEESVKNGNQALKWGRGELLPHTSIYRQHVNFDSNPGIPVIEFYPKEGILTISFSTSLEIPILVKNESDQISFNPQEETPCVRLGNINQ